MLWEGEIMAVMSGKITFVSGKRIRMEMMWMMMEGICCW
jgi:hypothetical protein